MLYYLDGGCAFYRSAKIAMMQSFFQQSFHTNKVQQIYQNWLAQDILPLKLSLFFNYLYVELVMIDVKGEVRRYRIGYEQPRWKIWWYLIRYAYIFRYYVLEGQEFCYERLYKNNLGLRKRAPTIDAL